MSEPKCFGCGHAKRNHINGKGLCLIKSCRMCFYRPAKEPIKQDAANLRNTVAIEDNLKTEAPIERKGPKT